MGPVCLVVVVETSSVNCSSHGNGKQCWCLNMHISITVNTFGYLFFFCNHVGEPFYLLKCKEKKKSAEAFTTVTEICSFKHKSFLWGWRGGGEGL